MRYVKYNITRDFTFDEDLKFCEIRRLAVFTRVKIFMNGRKKIMEFICHFFWIRDKIAIFVIDKICMLFCRFVGNIMQILPELFWISMIVVWHNNPSWIYVFYF